MITRRRVASFLALGWLGAGSSLIARAAPPPGVVLDPAVHEWFERQKNQNGTPCCDAADGHLLEEDDVRIVGDHYEVNILGKWREIRPYMMRQNAVNDANPMGKAIVWYHDDGQEAVYIFCFAPGYAG